MFYSFLKDVMAAAFLVAGNLATEAVVDRETELLVEVCRHGARASKYIYPLTKYPEDNFTVPYDLTTRGAEMHHAMGGYLRQKYIVEQPFLSGKYSADEVYVQTTYL